MKMAKVMWDGCRYPNGSICLKSAARQTGMMVTEQMDNFFSLVEAIKPIDSRQVAAIAIATAAALYPPSQPQERADG